MNNKKICKIAELSPTISTENMGDYIIKYYCDNLIKEIFGEAMTVLLSTRDRLSRLSMKHIASADYALVCGTNLLSSDMKHFRQWNLRLIDAVGIRCGSIHKNELFRWKVVRNKFENTHIILLGVGWYQYQDIPTAYTKRLLSILLKGPYLHSVRDSYTQDMLAKIGITNVINTACPTMWGLTPEKCASIPRKKADAVVTTLTNYRQNDDDDKRLLDCLLQCYKTVNVWMQAIEDFAYLKKLGYDSKVNIINPSLKAYEKILNTNIDYVGTRLHGGIHALNYGRRSLILALDNRALEIAKDTCLPVVTRSISMDKLKEIIMCDRETVVKLPEENIKIWKAQFLGG